MSNSIKHQEQRKLRAKQCQYEIRMRRNSLRCKYKEVIVGSEEKKS